MNLRKSRMDICKGSEEGKGRGNEVIILITKVIISGNKWKF